MRLTIRWNEWGSENEEWERNESIYNLSMWILKCSRHTCYFGCVRKRWRLYSLECLLRYVNNLCSITPWIFQYHHRNSEAVNFGSRIESHWLCFNHIHLMMSNNWIYLFINMNVDYLRAFRTISTEFSFSTPSCVF